MLNVTSLLGLTFSRSDIVSVEISTIGDESICGYVDVDWTKICAEEEDFWTVADGSASLTVTPGGSASSDGCFKTGVLYYACLMPQTYNQGLRIKMTTADDLVGTREITSPVLMQRSRMRQLSKSVDDGIEFAQVRDVKTLDFTAVGASTFKYLVDDTATDLPKRADSYISASEFWGASYPLYKFYGAVRYWGSNGGGLNMAGGSYVRLPRIDGYKLTAVTDLAVVHSTARTYKITSASASSYADGVAVKGGEEQSLPKSSSAATFTLTDEYDAEKDYYIVCNSEAGILFKLVYTPDDQLDPAPTGDGPVTTARWRIKTQDLTSAKVALWQDENCYYALSGEYAGTAYISTSGSAARTTQNNQLAVCNILAGDAVEFTVPLASTLAAGNAVDFMATLRSSGGGIPRYWIFEYYEDGQWKSAEQDLKTAAEDTSVKYSLFMTTEDDIYTSFCQNYVLASDASESLRMRLRAVGSVGSGGGSVTASSSNCLCFGNYYNNYVGCEIAVYRDIPVKDTHKAFFVGNSYTYYHGSYFMFEQIARSQGHLLRIRPAIMGGVGMGYHVNYAHVKAAVAEGGYDYAFIQESGVNLWKYYEGSLPSTLTNCQKMVDNLRAVTPDVQCSIEDTWAAPKDDYYGYGEFDTLHRLILGGALSVASGTGSWMTPRRRIFPPGFQQRFQGPLEHCRQPPQPLRLVPEGSHLVFPCLRRRVGRERAGLRRQRLRRRLPPLLRP